MVLVPILVILVILAPILAPILAVGPVLDLLGPQAAATSLRSKATLTGFNSPN
jgi:hypothetical protein